MTAGGWSRADELHMREALALAATQLNKTGNNPAVGCIIVKHGTIVGRGATADGGRPHAEAVALAQAQEQAQEATAYVTLEPCAHVSIRGGCCTDALIRAGIRRLVCCVKDPDPRTCGKGFDRLRQAGIMVEVGLLETDGDAQIVDFASQFNA